MTPRPLPSAPQDHDDAREAVTRTVACVLTPESGARRVLGVLGDKWALLAIYALEAGTQRFNELERLLVGVSPRMLTVTLRKLERAGFVTRTVYPEVPPRVEYALTELGRSLQPVTAALCAWSDVHAGALGETH